jgi:hypothetical protein
MSVICKLFDTDQGGSADLDIAFICTASESVGDAVYVVGAGTVSSANNSAIGTAKVIGFIVSKSSPTACKVRTQGEIAGLSGLTSGDLYFLDSTNGAITKTVPTAGILALVGIASSTTSLIIDIKEYIIL